MQRVSDSGKNDLGTLRICFLNCVADRVRGNPEVNGRGCVRHGSHHRDAGKRPFEHRDRNTGRDRDHDLVRRDMIGYLLKHPGDIPGLHRDNEDVPALSGLDEREGREGADRVLEFPNPLRAAYRKSQLFRRPSRPQQTVSEDLAHRPGAEDPNCWPCHRREVIAHSAPSPIVGGVSDHDDQDWANFSPDTERDSRRSLGTPEFIAIAVAVITLIGLAMFWPTKAGAQDAIDQISVLGIPSRFHEAVVSDVTEFPCEYSPTGTCVLVNFEIAAGSDAGVPYVQEFTVGATTPDFNVGDKVVLSFSPANGVIVALTHPPCEFDPETTCTQISVKLLDGPDAGSIEPVLLFPGQEEGLTVDARVSVTYDSDGVIVAVSTSTIQSQYQFADFQRRSFLGLLVFAFAAAVIALGRWRGVAALVGLGLTLVFILFWLIPSLLDGNPPVLVAIFGATAVAYLALYVSHGFSRLTTIALLGTVGALALTTLLSWLSVHAATFTGLATEESTLLILLDGIDLRGLLIAGIVIGAAGALDDVTVTQSSAIAQIRAAAPDISNTELFSRGLSIGRAHVGSIVNTLVLAYLGAALPLTILFILAQQSLGTVINSEVVAVEVVRTLVGTLGLVAAVPLTTWLATMWPASDVHEH